MFFFIIFMHKKSELSVAFTKKAYFIHVICFIHLLNTRIDFVINSDLHLSSKTAFSQTAIVIFKSISALYNFIDISNSTWGVGRNEGWGDSGADVADGKDAWPSHPAHQPVYDLVPEFEPGKPWKVCIMSCLVSGHSSSSPCPFQ